MATPERVEHSGRGWFRRRAEERYHQLAVLPSGLGATFRIRFARGDAEVTWEYDRGVKESARDAMTMARAADELRAAFGIAPSVATTVRPAWMGTFVWTPPLPASAADIGP